MSRLSKIFKNSFLNIHIPIQIFDKPKPVGRWSLNHQEIKGSIANIDSCGDNYCGDPLSIKKAVDLIIYKNSKKNNIV